MRKIGQKTIVVISAILVAASIFTTVIFFNNSVNDKNYQNAKLTTEISDLRNQIAYLNTANISATLTVKTHEAHNTTILPPGPYNYFNSLGISGFANNTGPNTAYKSGLHVLAQDANGKILINVTVPLEYRIYGPKDVINQEYLSNSTQPLSVYSGESRAISIGIYHEGTASNWTITPTWKNSS